MWNWIPDVTAPSAMLFALVDQAAEDDLATTPSPVQVGQAPAGLLNEKFAMPISGTGAPQCGQGKVSLGRFVGSSSVLSPLHACGGRGGGTSLPQAGQGRWPRRANSTRR